MSAVERCPKRRDGGPHVWAGANVSGDGRNPCVACGASGREHLARVTAARTELFSGLRAPKSVLVWGKAPS